MADPRPYYRTLRDQHPVYYIEDLDTYALSRFDDVWAVLEINDGTFVASEGTLPAAAVLARRNDGPVADPPLHHCRSTPTSTPRSTTTSAGARPVSSGPGRPTCSRGASGNWPTSGSTRCCRSGVST